MRKTIIFLLILMISSLAVWGWTFYQEKQPETMPLMSMMCMLLSDIKQIDEGIYTENYKLIKKGAASIADHPTMTKEDKKLVKMTLGKQVKKFVSLDMVVYHHADSMRMATIKKDMGEILRHYSIVQQGCVDCHANFRESIIDAR